MRKAYKVGESLTAAERGLSQTDVHRFRDGKKMVVCLLVSPSMVNGTYIGTQEWRDATLLQYGIEYTDLP